MDFISSLFDPIHNGLSETWNFLAGDPRGIKESYDKALGQSRADAEQMRNLLGQGKSQALGYYTPIQDMFKHAYGTGLKPQGMR